MKSILNSKFKIGGPACWTGDSPIWLQNQARTKLQPDNSVLIIDKYKNASYPEQHQSLSYELHLSIWKCSNRICVHEWYTQRHVHLPLIQQNVTLAQSMPNTLTYVTFLSTKHPNDINHECCSPVTRITTASCTTHRDSFLLSLQLGRQGGIFKAKLTVKRHFPLYVLDWEWLRELALGSNWLWWVKREVDVLIGQITPISPPPVSQTQTHILLYKSLTWRPQWGVHWQRIDIGFMELETFGPECVNNICRRKKLQLRGQHYFIVL